MIKRKMTSSQTYYQPRCELKKNRKRHQQATCESSKIYGKHKLILSLKKSSLSVSSGQHSTGNIGIGVSGVVNEKHAPALGFCKHLFTKLEDQRGQGVHSCASQLRRSIQSAHDGVDDSGSVVGEVQGLGQTI